MKRLSLHNPWPGAPVYFKSRTVSTMEDARRLLLSGCAEGTVVLADYQERGRGRISDRRWAAEPGKNLLFSLILRTGSGASLSGSGVQRLPLLAGLGLALTLEELFGLPARLKWPNDLLMGGQKLAGVLCEAVAEGDRLGILIGIGVNCNQTAFPRELAGRATSLLCILGREVSPVEILEELLRRLKAALTDGQWHAKVEERLYGLGRPAVLYAPPASDTGAAGPPVGRRGVIGGLNRDGALLFLPPAGPPISVYAGEVRFEGLEDS